MAFEDFVARLIADQQKAIASHKNDRDFQPFLDMLTIGGRPTTIQRGHWRKLTDRILVVDVAYFRSHGETAFGFDFGAQDDNELTHGRIWKGDALDTHEASLVAVAEALKLVVGRARRSIPRKSVQGTVIRLSCDRVYKRIAYWKRGADPSTIDGGNINVRAFSKTWLKVIRRCEAIEREWHIDVAFWKISSEENQVAMDLAADALEEDVEKTSTGSWAKC